MISFSYHFFVIICLYASQEDGEAGDIDGKVRFLYKKLSSKHLKKRLLKIIL
jgi:hypothetical protein